jgi:hypothetical protein
LSAAVGVHGVNLPLAASFGAKDNLGAVGREAGPIFKGIVVGQADFVRAVNVNAVEFGRVPIAGIIVGLGYKDDSPAVG